MSYLDWVTTLLAVSRDSCFTMSTENLSRQSNLGPPIGSDQCQNEKGLARKLYRVCALFGLWCWGKSCSGRETNSI